MMVLYLVVTVPVDVNKNRTKVGLWVTTKELEGRTGVVLW